MGSTLNRYRERLEADPARLEWLDERLAKFRALARRHSVEEHRLSGVLDTLRRRLADLDGGAESIEDLAARAASARAAYFERATQLSAARRKSAASSGAR